MEAISIQSCRAPAARGELQGLRAEAHLNVRLAVVLEHLPSRFGDEDLNDPERIAGGAECELIVREELIGPTAIETLEVPPLKDSISNGPVGEDDAALELVSAARR